MDLNDVAIFVSVVDAGSFTKAAKKLALPKSTVSRRIASLEESLGARLLQRTTRRVAPTDAGASYYEHAVRALGELREGEGAVSEIKGVPRGTLRVTAPVDLGVGALADIVADFAKQHPDVKVDVELTNRRVDLVAEGFDIALRAGPLVDSSLVARKIGELAAHVVAAPSYVDARGAPRSPDDLSRHSCLLFRGRAGKSRWTLEGPGGTRTVDVTGQLSGDDYLYVRKLALAGVGVALLPSLMAQHDVDEGALVRLLPDWEMRGAPLHLVYPSARHLPAKTAVFRDYVISACKSPFRSWAKDDLPRRKRKKA